MENEFTEIQIVLDFMIKKWNSPGQSITWGEMKEKFPRCVKMTSLVIDGIENGGGEDDIPDESLFVVPQSLIDSFYSFETAESAHTLSKYFKCLINVFIDCVGDMVAETNGYDSDRAERIKLESNKRFMEHYQAIDKAASEIFVA